MQDNGDITWLILKSKVEYKIEKLVSDICEKNYKVKIDRDLITVNLYMNCSNSDFMVEIDYLENVVHWYKTEFFEDDEEWSIYKSDYDKSNIEFNKALRALKFWILDNPIISNVIVNIIQNFDSRPNGIAQTNEIFKEFMDEFDKMEKKLERGR